LQTDQRYRKVRKAPRLNSKRVTAPERLRTVPARAPRGAIRESRKSSNCAHRPQEVDTSSDPKGSREREREKDKTGRRKRLASPHAEELEGGYEGTHVVGVVRETRTGRTEDGRRRWLRLPILRNFLDLRLRLGSSSLSPPPSDENERGDRKDGKRHNASHHTCTHSQQPKFNPLGESRTHRQRSFQRLFYCW